MLRAAAVLCVFSLPAFLFAQTVTFSKTQFASKGTPFVQADLNGDGITDIVSVSVDPNSKSGFFVMLSKKTGGYSAPVFYSSPYAGAYAQVAVGDFNNDGRVDVAEVEDSTGYYIFLNKGDGSLQPSWNFVTPGTAANISITAADFNSDGKLDLVLQDGNGDLKLLYGTGHGTFSAPFTIARAPNVYVLFVGDYDGDGHPDLAGTFAGACPRCPTEVSVYYSDGKGNFSRPTTLDFPDLLYFVSDNADGDGFTDFLGEDTNTNSVVILHGSANRTFNEQDLRLNKPPNGYYPVAADLNGDGIRDLALVELDLATGKGVLSVLLGNPGGSYQAEQYGYSAKGLATTFAGRYNTDTKPDLMVLKQTGVHFSDGYFEFLRNTTSGSFPSCNPPTASLGIAICLPADGSTVTSPVKFGVGAAFTAPLRKTEVWIDGVKKQESFNSLATDSFLDGTFAIASGTHRADVYAVAHDGRLLHNTIHFTVTGNGSLQYDVSLFTGLGSGTPQGQVTVDNAGATTVQLNQGPANTTYTVNFCPAPGQLYPNCFAVGTVTSNASGSVNSTVTFPSGAWAGDFQLSANGTVQFSTSIIEGVSSTYYATLQLDGTVNGKGTWTNSPPPPPQDPLQSGFATLVSPTLFEIQLTGAKPNTQYVASQCPLFRGSDCYGIGGTYFNTDGNGNITFTGSVGTDIPEDVVYVDNSQSGYGFIAGFKIP
jgi:hypothetical protein